MIIIISFYAFLLNPFLKTRESILIARTIAKENYEKYEKQYKEDCALIPDVIDLQGLNPKDKDYRITIIKEKKKEYKQQYKVQLMTNVLPYARNSFQKSGSEEDKNVLKKVLQNIIELSEDDSEKYAFDQEQKILQLSPMQNIELQNCPVEIGANPKDVKCYLYKLDNTIDGITHFIPMDVTDEENPIPVDVTDEENFEPEDIDNPVKLNPIEMQLRKQNFLRAQNLVLYGSIQMLHQKYSSAESSFIRALEIIPDYIDAYFFLCCNRMLGEGKNDFLYFWSPLLSIISDRKIKEQYKNVTCEEYCEYCGQVAKKCIEFYCPDPKIQKKLLSYFQKDAMQIYKNYYYLLEGHIQKFSNSKRYNEFNVAHFVKVIDTKDSFSSDKKLQDDDIILTIDKDNIYSISEFQEKFKNKTTVKLGIIRDFQSREITIKSEDWKNKKFNLISDFPFFYIYDNKYLSSYSSDSLQVYKWNQIKDKALSLPVGQYMVVCESSNSRQIRYPFEITQKSKSENSNNKIIHLEIPRIPEELQSEFVFIPSGFTSQEEDMMKKYQNNYGFLIGKYEITMGQWQDYLNASKNENIDNIEDLIPKIDDTPLFYLKNNKFVPCISKKYPVYGVTYSQIQKYLQWRTEMLPQELKDRRVRFRLPNEEEWTAVAQSGLGWKFPWGNVAMCQYCNIAPSRDYITALAFSGKYSSSFASDESLFGVCDMAGNIAEYTTTNERIASNNYYIVKGNAWDDLLLKDMREVRYVLDDLELEDMSKGRYYTGKNLEKRYGFRIAIGIDPIMGYK